MKVRSAFEELGFKNHPELESKSRLMFLIVAELKRRKLTQAAAGRLPGVDQPNVSALVNGRISRFSVGKFMDLILGLRFELTFPVEGNGMKFNMPAKREEVTQ